jgi:hypothetical protein
MPTPPLPAIIGAEGRRMGTLALLSNDGDGLVCPWGILKGTRTGLEKADEAADEFE